MKVEIAELWAQALESGKYSQVKGRLHSDEGYCCLGVLCELAIESGLKVEVERLMHGFNEGNYAYDNSSIVLPASIAKWAGIKDQQGTYGFDPVEGFCMEALTSDNDRGVQFPEIAATIRKVYGEL